MNLRALKDLSPVAVVTGMVANIRSKAAMDGYVPNSDAMHYASIIMHQCASMWIVAWLNYHSNSRVVQQSSVNSAFCCQNTQIWSPCSSMRPYLRQDIDLIEGVQRRTTKLIKSLKDETYEYRLIKLHLTSMETRRLWRDLIEVFKIFKGMDNLDVRKVFSVEKCTNQRTFSIYTHAN
jgi:hypothetical protein